MSAVTIDRLEQLDLGLVEVHKSNPRKDMGDLTELAASIKEVGVVEPIVVVRRNGHFEAVAGSRRLAAAKKAGLTQIPARVMDLDEAKAAAVALIENLQRKDLNPLEEAQGYHDYIALTGCQQKELAEKVGRAPSTIANALRLLEAPKPVKDALSDGTITAAHGRVLLTLRDPGLATKVKLRKGVTVDEIQGEVEAINRVYDTQGEGAVEAARKALADATAKHPQATIVWRAPRPYPPVVDLTKALGQAPSEFIRDLRQNEWDTAKPTEAMHDKACMCRAYELVPEERYERAAASLKFVLRRVCIDEKGWQKARPPKGRAKRSSRPPGSEPKPLTPAQLAAQERRRQESADKAAAKVLSATPTVPAKYAALAKVLAKGEIPAAAARAIVLVSVVNPDIGTSVRLTNEKGVELAIWNRIAKMPAKKLSKLAQGFLAQAIVAEIETLLVGSSWRKDEWPLDEASAIAIAAGFGVTIAPKKAPAKDANR